MLRPSRVLAISSLLGLTLVGCEQPTADRAGPVHAQLAAPASPTFYADRSVFVQQFPNLPVEDFEKGNVADGGVLVCPGPVDASNNNLCFSPSAILPGVEFNSDHGIDLIGRGSLGNPSKNIVVSVGGDAFIIDFTGGNVTATGMDLVSYSADICQMDVFGQPDASGVHADQAQGAAGHQLAHPLREQRVDRFGVQIDHAPPPWSSHCCRITAAASSSRAPAPPTTAEE